MSLLAQDSWLSYAVQSRFQCQSKETVTSERLRAIFELMRTEIRMEVRPVFPKKDTLAEQ